MKSGPHGNRGQALLEFAIVLPFLVLLLLAIYDFASAIRANNSISNMSREGANLASRTSIQPQAIMNTLAATAQPLDMQNKGMIYITVVQGTSGGPQIQSQAPWQNSNIKDSVSSLIGTPTVGTPNPHAKNLGKLKLTAGQTATVVEVFYKYQSLFSSNAAMLGKQLRSQTIY